MSDERDWLATNDPVLAILTDHVEQHPECAYLLDRLGELNG